MILQTAARRAERDTAARSASLPPTEPCCFRPRPRRLEALRIADQRMYAHKGAGRASAGRQSTDVLLRVLAERDPILGAPRARSRSCACGPPAVSDPGGGHDRAHAGRLAARRGQGRGPGRDPEQARAAERGRDFFIRRHTIIGERILGAAPPVEAGEARALEPRAIRRAAIRTASGRGDSDGSRIISVCDAYHAMISDRAYRPARSSAEAVAELRRCSGTQFDPAVVEAFCAVLTEQPQPPPLSPAPSPPEPARSTLLDSLADKLRALSAGAIRATKETHGTTRRQDRDHHRLGARHRPRDGGALRGRRRAGDDQRHRRRHRRAGRRRDRGRDDRPSPAT